MAGSPVLEELVPSHPAVSVHALLMHSLTHSFAHSFIHSFAHSFTHSLTYLFTHSLTCSFKSGLLVALHVPHTLLATGNTN